MDRRKRKTQANIVNAFYEVIAKESFEQLTVSKLCEVADINRGTFYLNYLDKYDLLEQVIKEEIRSLTEFCAAHEENTDHLTKTLEYMLTKKDRISLLLKADTQGLFTRQLRDFLRAENYSVSEVDAIFITNGLVGVLTHLLTTSEPSEKIISDFTRFLSQHQNFIELTGS